MIPRLPKGFSHPVCIGRGGFSAVYRVRQVALDRWVALKIVSEKDPIKRREMLNESRIHANINVAHIPRIYDTFEMSGRIYICMEWIRGVPLRVLLDEADRGAALFDDGQRLYVAEAFLKALALLHEAGFAHRDLKPENIIIAPDQGIYLVDFGLSKQVRQDGFSTRAGMAKGTPAYMAPELWQTGTAIDHQRADVWAVGKILLKILPTCWHQSVVFPLINDDPALRVANAPAALAQFKTMIPTIEPPPNWHALISALSRENLGRWLSSAARDLVYANRTDEAYWLLVESLNEHPDQPEAIDLMNRFPLLLSRRRMRRQTETVLITVALLVVCVTLAFLLGLHSGSDPAEGAVDTTRRIESERLATPLVVGNASMRNLPLLQSAHDHLDGIVQLVNLPAHGTLFVDGVACTDTALIRRGMALAWGMHILLWVGPDGSRQWSEHVRLLPFQTRRIAVQ
jgi:serine/threonine protein kinase